MFRLFDHLDRIADYATRAALNLCILLFAFATFLLAADITGRYVFNHPFQNVAETVTILFIYVFMLGAAALYSRNGDIALDYFFNRAPARVQAVWLFLIYLAIAVTMAVTAVETVRLIYIQRRVLTPSLRLPLGVEHAPLALAAAMIMFTSLVDALGCVIWIWRGERPVRRVAGL